MITSNLVGYEGPVTKAVTDVLAGYGYTVDDMDTTWFADDEKKAIFNEVTNLYGLNNNGRISARTYIFPGASVCIGLDETTPTGTYVFGNYTDSGVTSDGTKYPYMNITPDTFNKYYVGDFDLSKATLYKFYSDNPYDYRPDLYYKWYTQLFYETYGYTVDSKTYEDKASGVTIYGDKVMQDTKFAITKSSGNVTDYKSDGYTATSVTSYVVTSDATLTTTYNKRTVTGMNGATTETVTGEYTGRYVPYEGEILVSVPVDTKADKVAVYTSKGIIEAPVAEGFATVRLTSDETITVVGFTKNKNTVVVSKKVTVGKAKIKKVKRVKKTIAKITLKSVKGATGYVVKYSIKKGFGKKTTITKKVKKVTFILKKLKAKKKYYIKARAYKVVDKKTYYGKWSARKIIKK